MPYKTVIQSVEGLIREDTLEDAIHVSHTRMNQNKTNPTYLPSSFLNTDLNENEKIYFELENSFFYPKFVKQMQLEQSSIGVLRLQRRVHTSERAYLLVEDVMTLEKLLGKIATSHVLHSKVIENEPYIIVTLLFENKTMAHVEFHVTEKEEVNIEWNGKHNLVVFNSEEMNSFSVEPDKKSIPFNLQLSYDLLSKNAYTKQPELVERHQKWMDRVKEVK